MFKNVLKFAFIGLLFLCIIAVPIFGFHLYDSPSIFSENALFTNLQFGGGTSVYLTFSEEEEGNVTAEDYQKVADILKERFLAVGFSDIKTSVDGESVRVDLAQKTYIESTVASITTIGSWKAVGSSGDTLADASMIEGASVGTTSNGYVGITLDFTDEGAKKFSEKITSYAASGTMFYLTIDGQYVAYGSTNSASVKDTFTFIGFSSYETAAANASIIKNGELPASLEVAKTEELLPTFSSSVILATAIAIVIIFALCCAALILFGKLAGVFAILALASDIAIWATCISNGSFMLNLATIITMVLCLILITVFYCNAISPIGKALKEKKLSATGTKKALSKASIRCIWTHALAFAIALGAMFFTSGISLYIAKAVLMGACGSFAAFFVFIYFGIHCLFETYSNKKDA